MPSSTYLGALAALAISVVNAGLCKPSSFPTTTPVISVTIETPTTELSTPSLTTPDETITIETTEIETPTTELSTPSTTPDETITIETTEIETPSPTTLDETFTRSTTEVETPTPTPATTSEEQATTTFASISSTFFPADLFPCSEDSDCLNVNSVCDQYRCGCLNLVCVPQTATASESSTAAAPRISDP